MFSELLRLILITFVKFSKFLILCNLPNEYLGERNNWKYEKIRKLFAILGEAVL